MENIENFITQKINVKNLTSGKNIILVHYYFIGRCNNVFIGWNNYKE
jgi:hypothetical protein